MKKYWTEEPENLWDFAHDLKASHNQRVALDKATTRHYYQRPTVRYDQDVAAQVTAHLDMFGGTKMLGYNLTRELVDTALPMVVRSVQERVLPVGADYEVYKSCQQLTKLGRGILDANRIDELAQRVALDSMATCVGAVKVFVDAKKEIRLERVNPMTLFWPLREGPQPQTLTQIHSVPRRRLIAEYPDQAELIEGLPQYLEPAITGVESTSGSNRPDNVEVVEGWAISIGKVKGKHAIVVQGAVLGEVEDYDSEEHCIIPLRWAWDHDDFGGISVARIAAPMHIWSNRLVRVYYESLKGAVPVIWEHESEEAFEGIADFEFQRAKYNGASPPVITVANTVSTQVVEAIEAVRQRAYNETGIPFSIATGQKPVGLNSAPAQREWLDTLNIRIRQPQERYERWRQDIFMAVARLAGHAYKSKAARVQAPGTDWLEEITFPDLKEDQYKATVGISSGLSLTVSGRIDQVKELQGMGLIRSQRDVAKHVDLPDTRALQEEINAPRQLAEKMAWDALNEKVYTPPSRVQDLVELLDVCKSRYQMALARGTYPAANLACLYRLIKVVEQRITPTPVPEAAAMPGAPMPAPGLPPDPLGMAAPVGIPAPTGAAPPPAEVPIGELSAIAPA